MSMTELNSTARDLMSVRAMIAELETEAEALTDKIKGGYGGAGGGSPSGGRMESHMEERGQQPVRQQAVQGRPRRPLRPVQQGHHHDPLHPERMRKAPCKNADQSNLQEAPVNPEGVREIIHPAPSRNQGGIYKRDFSIDKKGMRPLGLCPHDSARRMPPGSPALLVHGVGG